MTVRLTLEVCIVRVDETQNEECMNQQIETKR